MAEPPILALARGTSDKLAAGATGEENKHLYALTSYARSQSAGRRREAEMETRFAGGRREIVSDRHRVNNEFGACSNVAPD
jgi:hypothetical protein